MEMRHPGSDKVAVARGSCSAPRVSCIEQWTGDLDVIPDHGVREVGRDRLLDVPWLAAISCDAEERDGAVRDTIPDSIVCPSRVRLRNSRGDRGCLFAGVLPTYISPR